MFGYQDAPYDGFYDPYSEEHQYNTIRNEISVICGRLVVYLRGAVLATNWILFLLAFIEPPHWCREGDNKLYGDCKETFDLIGTTADGEENTQLYPNAGMLLLSVSQSQWIELHCVVFGFLYLLLQFADDGFILKLFFYQGYKRIAHLSQIILMICIIAGIIAKNTVLNPFFRMLLLGTYLRTFQREFLTFINMVRQNNNIISLITFFRQFSYCYTVVCLRYLES